MNKENIEVKNMVKKALADQLGIEVGDIEDDFSLTEDLHMKPTDITDFIEILKEMKIDSERLDFSEIETFEDLIENIIDL